MVMVDAAPVMDVGVDVVPLSDAGGTQPLVDTRRPSTTASLVLMSWFLLVVGIPIMYYVYGAPAHLLPHMLAGSGAGMLAVGLCYPLQHARSISWREGGLVRGLRLVFAGLSLVLAAQGILKAISSVSYAYFHSVLTCGAVQGMTAVAEASLATGIVVGLVSAPLEQAQRFRKDNIAESFVQLARNGLFSRQGLYGHVGSILTLNVVSFEAFYLSYHCLLAAYPWLGIGMLGTALAGAASGVVALLAGMFVPKITNAIIGVFRARDIAEEKAWKDIAEKSGKETLSVKGRLEALGKSILLVALNSSLLFVFYRALYLVLSS
eukprot:CAMPEP_0181291266 /NCGR_PEP_ID=MMETSP1101-20121128/1874_1 /TAXON_ID=46948 /ORGANISM="Rhodomonas abbreviata, Strain Caron Lab Isolate" /LENGTH=320 /DNA_ID=CAMNT_0023395643 /DNA_START=372 /DNA_END=1334 /DNA_ORIENTATION=+